jgi:hypothetical protein
MDGDVPEEKDASQPSNGSMSNVGNREHSRFHLGTSDVERTICEHGLDVHAVQQDYMS